MNILIVSVSFAIKESIGNVFEEMFENATVKSISTTENISKKELDEIDLIFIEIIDNVEKTMEIVQYLKNKCKNVFVIILDRHKCKYTFKQAVQIGVDGYILYITEKEEFKYFITKIVQGHKVYHPDLVSLLLSKNHMNSSDEILTKREKDVLDELKKGITNKEIANNLYITEHTVKKHIGNILDKLNLKNRQEAILYSTKNI